jgi:hypothetical protein
MYGPKLPCGKMRNSFYASSGEQFFLQNVKQNGGCMKYVLSFWYDDESL